MSAWRAVLVAVSVLCASPCFCAAEKVIFDTDIGGDVDDALALAYLACNPQCELLGVTVEGWNSLKQAEIASAICHDLGRGEIPIHAGCNAPMLTSAHYSGTPSGDPRYWSVVTNRPHQTFERIDAVEFLRDATRRNPGKITLIATGQFTNLGVLFSRYPELPGQLKRLAPTGVDCAEAAKRIPLKVSRKGKETRYETYLPYDVFSLNTISFGIAVSGSICSSTTTTGLAASTVGRRSSRASRPTRMLQSIRG